MKKQGRCVSLLSLFSCSFMSIDSSSAEQRNGSRTLLFEIGPKLISDIRRDTVSFRYCAELSSHHYSTRLAWPAKSVFRQLYGVCQALFYEQLHKMPPDTAWRQCYAWTWWFVVAGGHHVYVTGGRGCP